MTDEVISPALDDGAEVEASLRDDLRSAMDEVTSREEFGGDVAPAPATGDAAVVEAPAGDTAKPVAARDASGRFAPKADAPAAVSAAAPGAEQQQAAPTAPEEAPSSWRADAKAKWNELPAEVRGEIARRERSIAELTGRVDGERRFGREFAEIIRPHADTIKSFGVTPQFAVDVLLKNDQTMRKGSPEQKIALARTFIRDYGIDPRHLVDPNDTSDPRMTALQRENELLKQRQQIPPQFDHAPLPTPEGAGNVSDDIAAFRADPANPHFDTVLPKMAELLEAGTASDLADAYAQAVAATPSLRSTPQAQPAPTATVPPSDAQRQTPASKAAAARRASASVGGSPGPAGSPASTSMRDELREQLRKSGFNSG